jgi:hypothetical protein
MRPMATGAKARDDRRVPFATEKRPSMSHDPSNALANHEPAAAAEKVRWTCRM